MADEVAGSVTGASMPDGGGWSASMAWLTKLGKRAPGAGAAVLAVVLAGVVGVLLRAGVVVLVLVGGVVVLVGVAAVTAWVVVVAAGGVVVGGAREVVVMLSAVVVGSREGASAEL